MKKTAINSYGKFKDQSTLTIEQARELFAGKPKKPITLPQPPKPPLKKLEELTPTRFKINDYEAESTFIFKIVPCPAPRMTQSDQWKTDPYHPDPKKRQREPVMRYFAFKEEFVRQANQLGFTLPEVLDVIFVMPMPDSWSDEKKAKMDATAHKQKPDRDNLLKALCDAFGKDDSHIWDGRTTKIWGYEARIIIY